MANPTGKGGRKFKKGESGNLLGRPKQDPLLKQFKETTYKEFLDGLQKFGSLTQSQMKEELKREDATMFEVMFGQIVYSAAKGDKDSRQVLLDRLWGKVKDRVDIEIGEKEKIKNMSTEELKDFVKQHMDGT